MSEEEEAASITEPDLTPAGAANPVAAAGSVSDGRGPKTLLVTERQMSLSEVLERDQFVQMLRMLTLPELRVLKGVSRKWRDRVRALISDPNSVWRRTIACRASKGALHNLIGGTTRLIKEHKAIASNENLARDMNMFTLGPYTSFLDWRAVIHGPSDTLYEGGLYELEITLAQDYPLGPPRLRFITPICHPNVDADGVVKVDLLGSKWSAACTIGKLLLAVISILDDPNFDVGCAADKALAQLWHDDRRAYEARVRAKNREAYLFTSRALGGGPSAADELAAMAADIV